MASEIRVNKINSQTGVGTITLSPTGVDISGITTVSTLKVGTGVTASEDGDIFFTGVCTATTFAGSGANLTALPAANITGTLPAISAANLTNIPAANIVGLATAGFERSGGFSSGTEMFDIWTLSSNASVTSSSGYITSNWVRANSYQATIGSAMTESSGIFTFPSTGIYRVRFSNSSYNIGAAANRYIGAFVNWSTNSGGSYSILREQYGHINNDNSCTTTVVTSNYLDITNTSTTRIKFTVAAELNSTLNGGSYGTYVEFLKLGET